MSDQSQRYVTLDAEQAARVARFVNERMTDIPSMNLARLEQLSGVSVVTIRPLIRGTARNYWPNKLRQISDALGWTPDSIDQIVAGDGPVVSNGTGADERLSRIEGDLADVRWILAAVVDHLGIQLPPGAER